MLLNKLLPDIQVDTIYDIDLEALKSRGIKGIITDLDNTLIEWNRPSATPELAEWLQKVQDKGYKLIVVSNNNAARVGAFASPLGIPFIHRANKPFHKSFKLAQKMMKLQPDQVVVIGDQIFTDVLGGNRLNLHTILVIPIVQSDNFSTRFIRRLERIALDIMKKRGMVTWKY